MSSHGNYDNAANAPYWAVMQVSKGINKDTSAPNLSNVTQLFGNNTVNAYTTGATVGLFHVDTTEISGNGNVTSITVTSAGAGYTALPQLTILGANTTQATAVANLTLVSVDLTSNANFGTNYTVGDRLYANTSANGTNAVITVASVGDVTVGNVTSVTLTTPGNFAGPLALPISWYPFTSNTVARANATGFRANLTFGIGSVRVTGAGYQYHQDTVAAAIAGSNTTSASLTVNLTGDWSTNTHGHPATHTGWVLRTVGTGGRAGRIQWETLATLTSGTGSGADDIAFPQ
jgi:hypothetical protein